MWIIRYMSVLSDGWIRSESLSLYIKKMQKSGEWRTVCELDKPGVLLFLDADTLLLSGVKSTDAPVQPDSVPTRFSTFSCSAEEWKETFTLPLKTADVQRLTKTQLLIKAEIQLKPPMLMPWIRNRLRSGKKHSGENADYTVLEELPWCADGRGIIQGKTDAVVCLRHINHRIIPADRSADELRQRFRLP